MKLPTITVLAFLLTPLASALPQLEAITRYKTLDAYCKAAGPDAVRSPQSLRFLLAAQTLAKSLPVRRRPLRRQPHHFLQL